MSRPTKETQQQQAEAWMLKTFGHRLGDYLTKQRQEPLSVAIVEVDRILKASGARTLLTQWQAEDALSSAGRKSFLTPAAVLGLLLLQMRLRRPTLLTEVTKTMIELSPAQRAVLLLTHDGIDERFYNRIWSAVQRLIALVDEFPGRRDKILLEHEYREVVAKRDPGRCQVRRTRMFTLANALLEGTWRLLPEELCDRCDGNVAIDATLVPLGGKIGNPTAENLDGNRKSVNPDGGWYRREGSHGAVTRADAKVLNRLNPGARHKGTSASKLTWGVEVEIARLTANKPGEAELFPLMTTAISFHIPGVTAGEGHRLLASLHERKHPINFVLTDRAYSGGKYPEYQVPARLLGAKLVFDYKKPDLGVQASDSRGFVQVSGTWYLDSLPETLREADAAINTARNKYGEKAGRLAKAEAHFKKQRESQNSSTGTSPIPGIFHSPETILAKAQKELGKDAHALAQAEELYAKQLEQRTSYMLKDKGRMAADWTRRYLIPDAATPVKQRTDPYQGKTVMMKRPVGKEAKDANAGGLKHEQYFPYGSADWKAYYGMRSGVESLNRNIKRSQFENIANPDNRAVRGNTFTYLIATLATMVENLRQMLSFYKRKLAIATVTAKNRELPSTFWQSDGPVPGNDPGQRPPN